MARLNALVKSSFSPPKCLEKSQPDAEALRQRSCVLSSAQQCHVDDIVTGTGFLLRFLLHDANTLSHAVAASRILTIFHYAAENYKALLSPLASTAEHTPMLKSQRGLICAENIDAAILVLYRRRLEADFCLHYIAITHITRCARDRPHFAPAMCCLTSQRRVRIVTECQFSTSSPA